MADPGRPYAPKDGIDILISATLPTTMELEAKRPEKRDCAVSCLNRAKVILSIGCKFGERDPVSFIGRPDSVLNWNADKKCTDQ